MFDRGSMSTWRLGSKPGHTNNARPSRARKLGDVKAPSGANVGGDIVEPTMKQSLDRPII